MEKQNKDLRTKKIILMILMHLIVVLIFGYGLINYGISIGKKTINNQVDNNNIAEVQEENNNTFVNNDKKQNETNENKDNKKVEPKIRFVYKKNDVEQKEVIVEKEVLVNPDDATITYKDSLGNATNIKIPKGTTLSFDEGEHGLYDVVPSPITLSENQQLDITDSSYNPSSVEANYIFEGFSYSGNTMKCEYSLANKTIITDCKQIAKPIIKGSDKYLQLDYIESDGSQYINTNIEISEAILKQNLSIEVECAFSDTTITANQANGKNQNNFFFFGANTSSVFYSGIGKDYQASTKSYDTKFHKHKLEVKNNKGKYYVDNVVATDYGTIPYITPEYEGEFHLGDTWTPVGGNVYIAKSKFKRCTCYFKGELFKDLIPVERLDGVIGMFDLKNGDFLTNVGAGEFNHPDIKSTAGTNIGKIFATGTYENGSTLELTALANDGYQFVRWADGNINQARTVTIEDGAVYTAFFAPNE